MSASFRSRGDRTMALMGMVFSARMIQSTLQPNVHHQRFLVCVACCLLL
jgi:hypothetical protein